jgi:hypothetical protein
VGVKISWFLRPSQRTVAHGGTALLTGIGLLLSACSQGVTHPSSEATQAASVCNATLALTGAIDAGQRKEQDGARNARTEEERRAVVASRLEGDANASDETAARLEAAGVGASQWASSVRAAAADLRRYAQANRQARKDLLALPADRSETTLAALQNLQDDIKSAVGLLSALESIPLPQSPECLRLRTVFAEPPPSQSR